MADETTAGTGEIASNAALSGSIPTVSNNASSDVTILSEVILPSAKDISDEVGLLRPNAAPASAASSSPSQQTIAPTPSPTAPTNTDIKTDIEKILREVKLPERRDFKGSADAKAVPNQPPSPVSPQSEIQTSVSVNKPPTETEMPKYSAVSAMHTLKDDLQHAVKEKKMSLVRAVSLEQDKKNRIESTIDFGRMARRKRMATILISSFAFFLLGAAALFGVYTVVQSRIGSDTPTTDAIVFAEQSVTLPLDNVAQTLKQQVAAFRASPGGSLGSIIRIKPIMPVQNPDGTAARRDATLLEFLTAIGAHPPEELVRALGNDFFFGLHVTDKNAPVLVMTVNSYDHAFAGMLAWEETMNGDLAPAFTAVPVTTVDANGIPTARVFKDTVMRNYDVRELKDDLGQVQLYYSFPNPRLLIIAESPFSFPELLSRLQSERRL